MEECTSNRTALYLLDAQTPCPSQEGSLRRSPSHPSAVQTDLHERWHHALSWWMEGPEDANARLYTFVSWLVSWRRCIAWHRSRATWGTPVTQAHWFYSGEGQKRNWPGLQVTVLSCQQESGPQWFQHICRQDHPMWCFAYHQGDYEVLHTQDESWRIDRITGSGSGRWLSYLPVPHCLLRSFQASTLEWNTTSCKHGCLLEAIMGS